MASTSSGLSKKIVLGLLDDQPGLRADSLDWSIKTQIATAAVKAPAQQQSQPPPPLSAPPSKQNKNPLLAKKQAPQGQIFRSATTFKQLLDEYNKPHRAPSIKSRATQDYLPGRKTGFTSDSVEHIELPSIPGKILRPE